MASSFSTGIGSHFLLVVQRAPCRQCASQSTATTAARSILSRTSRLSSPSRTWTTTTTTTTTPSAARFFQTTTRARVRVVPTTTGTTTTTKLSPKPTTPRSSSAKPAPNSKPLPPKTTTTTITRAQPPSYAEQLAAKGRTLLYEAPSHFWFRTSSFMSGAFCVSYTVYQYWAIYLHPPEGLYWWIPNAFAVICVFMVGMGGYFVHGTRRIVRSIEAVPARMVKMAATGASSGAATTTTTTPRASDLARRSPVYIEVTTRRVLPFLPPKKMLYRPDEIQLPFRMQGVLEGARLRQLQMEQPKSLLAQVRAARAKQEQIEKERKHTLDHIMTAPFRDFAKVVGTAARGMQRAFNREGFTKLKLKDTEYKLDVSGGWALDDGRALDRLLTVKQRR